MKPELNFASWGSITEVGIIKELIKEYETENPEIKINFIHIPQNYFQKIHLLFASNTPPDVIFINNLYLPLYEKYLEDLSEYVDKSEYYSSAVSGLSYGGRLLAIPRDISELVFYVNLDKVPLPDKNWKLEDLLKYKFPNAYTVSYEDNIYWVTPYLSYYGGSMTDENYNIALDSEESIKAINFYRNLKDKYKIAPSKSQVGSLTQAQMFLDEKIIFYLSGRWMYPKISEDAKFNWAVINFPYGDSPQLSDASGWAVAKQSKRKDEAIKFVRFLSDKKSSEYFTNTGLIMPARIDTSGMLNKNEHNERVFLDAAKHSVNTPVNKDYKKITDKINSELDL